MKTTQVILKFPTQFSKYVNNAASIEFKGETVIDFIDYLDSTYGDVKERLLQEDNGQLRPYINLFIGSKNIKSLNNLESVIESGEKVSLLLSRAGG